MYIKVFGNLIVKEIIRDSLFSRQLAALHLCGVPTPMDAIYNTMNRKDIEKVVVTNLSYEL